MCVVEEGVCLGRQDRCVQKEVCVVGEGVCLGTGVRSVVLVPAFFFYSFSVEGVRRFFPFLNHHAQF